MSRAPSNRYTGPRINTHELADLSVMKNIYTERILPVLGCPFSPNNNILQSESYDYNLALFQAFLSKIQDLWTRKYRLLVDKKTYFVHIFSRNIVTIDGIDGIDAIVDDMCVQFACNTIDVRDLGRWIVHRHPQSLDAFSLIEKTVVSLYLSKNDIDQDAKIAGSKESVNTKAIIEKFRNIMSDHVYQPITRPILMSYIPDDPEYCIPDIS